MILSIQQYSATRNLNFSLKITAKKIDFYNLEIQIFDMNNANSTMKPEKRRSCRTAEYEKSVI